jgi:hypothetical protein
MLLFIDRDIILVALIISFIGNYFLLMFVSSFSLLLK